MSEPELVEDFFGVYLLICKNPKYKGRTYIGYTRDPKRRITQHNKGSWAGGALRTSNRGPWKMVMIVHGFPNNISALRFEWAWQNPNKTIRLQHLNLRKIPRKETVYKFKLRVLSEMLRVGPWCRLPLTIRWLEQDYFEEFPDERKPPDHMTICHGPVKSRNLKKKSIDPTPAFTKCLLCSGYINANQVKLTCLNSNCQLECHIICLADLFLSPGEYVPIEGICPFCSTKLKWGDLIRKMRGCRMGDVIENDKSDSVVDDDDKNDSVVDDDNNDSVLVDDDDKNDSAVDDDNNDSVVVDDGDMNDVREIEGENSDESEADYLSVLKKVNERRPSWLFEDF